MVKPYTWVTVSLAELEGYIGKAVRVIIEDVIMQGILHDVYEDGLFIELNEGHLIFLENEVYAREETRYEVVQVIEFPEFDIPTID